MSNSNNPFLPYLTKENNNDNQNNNEAKDNNNISNILEEEGSTSAVPPPAYDEVVKPQPVHPNSEYPAYPPPPFSPPEMPVRENYNQSFRPSNPQNVHNNSNFNEKWGRNACCSGSSRRNKTCGCGWMIVLVLFVILGLISLINNKVCNDLTLGETPQTFSFDPSTNTVFLIDTNDARVKSGEVRVIQSPPSQGNGSVNIQVYTGSGGVTPKFDTSEPQNGTFRLKISQPGFSILNIPPRCMITKINVNIPQQSSFPSTIQAGDLNVIMEQNNNTIPYQNITLFTTSGDISLKNVNAQTMELDTNNGYITGNIASISDRLNIRTYNGNTNLHLGNAQTHFNSKTSVRTKDGDVFLTFDGNSFSGNYNMQTQDGRIRINGEKQSHRNKATGTIGNGNGTLDITTDDGNINVTF